MIYERNERGLRRAIGYDVRGEGPALVFLHPFPFDRSFWARARAALPDFRTVAVDARGFGDSALGEPGYSIDELGEDVIALCDHLGILMCTAIGCSMGGYVALSLAARHPARLSALVLVDTRADADGPEARANRQGASDELRAHGPSGYLDGVGVRLCGKSASADVREEVQHLAVGSSRDFSRALPAMLIALRDRPDRRALLPTLRLPSLVVVGAEDAVTPPDEARQMMRAIPGAQLALIDGAGHLPSIERRQAFDDTLGAFIRAALLTD